MAASPTAKPIIKPCRINDKTFRDATVFPRLPANKLPFSAIGLLRIRFGGFDRNRSHGRVGSIIHVSQPYAFVMTAGHCCGDVPTQRMADRGEYKLIAEAYFYIYDGSSTVLYYDTPRVAECRRTRQRISSDLNITDYVDAH